MLKFGIIHYNLPSLNLDEFLDYAYKTGYRYVELFVSDVWPDESINPKKMIKTVKSKLDEKGLKVSALAAGNDFVVLDPDVVRAQVDRFTKVCEIAAALDTSIVRTEGGFPKDEVDQSKLVDAMAGCLEKCVTTAENLNMKLAVDNHGYVTNDADLQVELFEKVNSKHVGANLDTMNYRWAGHSLGKVKRFYEKITPYVFHAHLKDGTGSLENYVGAALGEGEIDLKHVIKCLDSVGYDGVWCAEYEGPEDSCVGYKKCFDWMKNNLK